jgi:hypothetical protein
LVSHTGKRGNWLTSGSPEDTIVTMAQNVNRCFQCKSTLKKTAKFAKCGLCQNDFHFTCTAIIQEKYNFIQNNGGQWYCEGCSRCAGKVLQRLQTLEETQIKMQDYCKELEEKLESATQKIVDLESQLEVVVKTTNQKFEEQMNQVPQPSVTKKQSTTLKSDKCEGEASTSFSEETSKDDPGKRTAIDEMEDRERRKCNLVFYGLLESAMENPKDRVEEDKTGVMRALEKIQIQMKPFEIVSIFRAGKKSEKARPLVVKLSSKERRDEIIRKGKSFKETTNITVSPDLTFMQRQNLSQLYTEAEEKNQNEAENYEWKVVGPRDLPSLVRRRKKQN